MCKKPIDYGLVGESWSFRRLVYFIKKTFQVSNESQMITFSPELKNVSIGLRE